MGKRRPAWGKLALTAAWRWTPLGEIASAENIVSWTRAVRGTWWAPIVLVGAYTAGAFMLFPRLRHRRHPARGARHLLRRARDEARDRAPHRGRRARRGRQAGQDMLPTPPFAVQNIIAGAIRVRLWEFMAGTALALIPPLLAWTVFGDQIVNALEQDASVNFWLVGGALVLLAGFAYGVRRWLRKKGF